jgi:hypothetical protein
LPNHNDYESDYDYEREPREGYDDDRDYRRGPPPERGERMPPYKPKKVSYKCIGGMVVAIVALIFIFIFTTSAYNWYTVSYELYPEGESTLTEERNLDYYLTEFEYKQNLFSLNQTNASIIDQTISYDDPLLKDQNEKVRDVMEFINLFYLLTILMLIISIALIPIAAMGKIPYGIAMAFLLIALILTLIIPLYFFIYFPPALEEQFIQFWGNETAAEGFDYKGDFFGTRHGDYTNIDSIQMEWELKFEPGMAFWISFVIMFIILVAIGVYSSGRKDIPGKRPPIGPPPRGGGRGEPPPRYDRGYDDRGYDDGYDEPPRRSRGPPARPPRPPRGDYGTGGGGARDGRAPPRPPRRARGAAGHDDHYDPPVLRNS